MGLDPGSQRLKVMPLPLERMVDAKGGEQAGCQAKRVGVRLCADTVTNKPKQSAGVLQRR